MSIRVPGVAVARFGTILLWALAATLVGYGIYTTPDDAPAVTSGVLLIVACIIGPLVAASPLDRRLAWLRNPTVIVRRSITIAVFVLTIAYVIFANRWLKVSLTPFWHDDQMHAVQARMFAEGHLLMPSHPLADFFETFHVFVKPVYAGIHFLGTTLLNGPGLWAGLPTYAVPLACIGLAVAMTYRVITELIDGFSALMAVLLMWCDGYLRFLGPRMTSHGAMLMVGMMLVWTWLHWRRHPTMPWAVVFGLLAGLALITRPLDAAAYLAPLGGAMLFGRDAPPWRCRLAQAAAAGACILPFAALQLHFDREVTGHYLYSPYQLYNDTNYPGINYDLRTIKLLSNDLPKTPSTLPQKQLYYNEWLLGFVRNAQRVSLGERILDQRLMFTLQNIFPDPLVYLFIPLALVMLTTPARRTICLIVPLYIAVYIPHYFYLPHYPTIISPPLILMVLLGVQASTHAVPLRYARVVEFSAFTLIVFAAMRVMPPFTVAVARYELTSAAAANEFITPIVKKPAIVLFHFTAGDDYHDEPVYNFERAWPDDESVVRAQDLGPRNIELFKYYAQRQPDRTVYLWSRRNHRLYELGNVKTLAETAAPQPTTTQPATTPAQEK